MSIPSSWDPNQQLLSLSWAWVAGGWKLFDDDCIVCHSPDNDLSDNDTIRIGSSFHQKGILPWSKDWEKKGKYAKSDKKLLRIQSCTRHNPWEGLVPYLYFLKILFGLCSFKIGVCCKEKFKLSQSSCQSLDRLRKYVKVQPFKPRHNLHYSI